MTKDSKYVPYSESKTREERIAYVKANPDKYLPYAEWKAKQDAKKQFMDDMFQKFMDSQK